LSLLARLLVRILALLATLTGVLVLLAGLLIGVLTLLATLIALLVLLAALIVLATLIVLVRHDDFLFAVKL
jgi:hypothetical protein